MKAQLGIHPDGTNTDAPPEGPTLSLHRMYAELDCFGQSLATRFGTGTPAVPPPDCNRGTAPRGRVQDAAADGQFHREPAQ